MTRLLKILPLFAALVAAPVLAAEPDPHADHHASAAGETPKAMADMNEAELHAHCKAMMGHKMDGRVPHDHSVEKLGHAPPPAKPLSEAEMKAQHDKCTAIMAAGSAGLKK